MTNLKQFEVLKRASLFLEQHGREPRVAEYLLQHYLDVSRTEFFMNMHEVVPAQVVEKLTAALNEHVKTGVPLQHLTGEEEIYGRLFTVNKHVLIPRPETEELVMHVLQAAERFAAPRIIDVGTGSGVIAVTLAAELTKATVTATDISRDALTVAEENAIIHQCTITFLQGDYLQPIVESEQTVDIIVSNPPYIAFSEKTTLADTVRNFDPELALFAENDGLHAYESIIHDAKYVLSESGIIAFEIGHTQGEAVKALLQARFPEKEVEIIKDINQKDRIVIAK